MSKKTQVTPRKRRADTLNDLRKQFLASDLLQELIAQAHQAKDSGDSDGMFRVAENLMASFPDQPEAHLILAGAAGGQGFAALFVHGLRTFLRRWPEHPQAEAARNSLAAVEQALNVAANPTPLDAVAPAYGTAE